MLEEFDKNVSVLTESITRKIARRKLIGTTIKGLFATSAALTFGQLINVKQAFAASCTCDNNWTTGHLCSGCPSSANCPSGCTVCTTTQSCGGWCNYSNGRWTSCTGQGTCGVGYKICTDCICPSCSNRCTCLSGCVCCNCCTHAEVEAEMKRLVAMGIAMPTGV